MTKADTKSKVEKQPLYDEHELPAAETGEPEETKPAHQTISREDSPGSRPDLEKLRAERDFLADRLARQQAEFENARKRAAREQQEFQNFALADALNSLLPVLDSFEQALLAPAQNVEEFRSGIELIRKQWLDTMSKLGLTPIPALGERFDPRLHEAIATVETQEAEDSRVLEELQQGYKLGDRLLRPARVRVARNPGADSRV
jgi:molecular chaperone GrpE